MRRRLPALALACGALVALIAPAFAPAVAPAVAPAGGPFTDLGFGLPGQSGFTPLLEGEGTLRAGEPVTLTVSKCAKSSLAHLVIGASNVFTPLLGGTLVPSPDRVLVGVETRKGLIILEGDWPAGIPSGMQLTLQWWVQDGAAVQGYSASNALLLSVP